MKGQRLKRVYHHHEKCEEFRTGMWRNVQGKERDILLHKAAELMKDAIAFRDAMFRAAIEWPYSCEMNLTAISINHRAWMGHAGCCIVANSPEDTTRLAWHTLNQEEQDLANAAADDAIAFWKERYMRAREAECPSANWELMF